MDNLFPDFGALFSTTGLFAFVSGILCTRSYYYFKCRYLDKAHPEEGHHVSRSRGLVILWALIFVLIGYMWFKTEETSDDVAQLSKDTAACQTEFNVVLRERARIAAENDNWSKVQRKALADWLHEILMPPPEMLAIRSENTLDPRYQKWAFDTTQKYYTIIQKAQDEQDENFAERAKHPLPDPNCGKQSLARP